MKSYWNSYWKKVTACTLSILITLSLIPLHLWPSAAAAVGAEAKQTPATQERQLINRSQDAVSRIVNNASFSPMSVPSEPIQHVVTRPNEAPFTVQFASETVSTLTGGLIVHEADLSLPGRGGLSFTLSRTYDSSAAQYYPLDYTTGPAASEKRYPIGLGWSWDLSFIEKVGSKQYVHLSGAGVYELDGTTLKGYPWQDITFAVDTTVTVNGVQSRYAIRSIHQRTQHFALDGRLLQIADAYGNTIQFHYATQGDYTDVLSSIVDATGKTITITYNQKRVILTSGTRTVTYIKRTENGKDLLAQVWDPLGRATTYDYAIQTARYNLQGTWPNTDNPYALLTAVTHPTGARSVYAYEATPITRYIGDNMVNQAYRVTERKNQLFDDTNVTEDNLNRVAITYSGDMASAHATDLTFSATLDNGRTTTVFANKKDYIDDTTPAAFYNTKVTSTAGDVQRVTDYTYDEARRFDAPIRTESQTIRTSPAGQSPAVVTVRAYDDYGNVTSEVDPLGAMTVYAYDSTTHLMTAMTEPISSTQTRYTAFTRNAQGDVTQVAVRQTNASGPLLRQVDYGNVDSYGNVRLVTVKDGSRNVVTTYEYGAAYQSVYPTKRSVTVTAADNTTSVIAQQYTYDAATGNVLSVVDGRGFTTGYAYDALGRVTQTTHPDASTIRVRYDDANNTLTLVDETGITAVTRWSPLGWKLEEGLVEGGALRVKGSYSYDTHGRLVWSEDALGQRTSYAYDDWDRQTSVTYPDATSATVQYDDILSRVTSADPLNNRVRDTFDLVGRVTEREEIRPTGSVTVTAAYTYDTIGNVRTAKDAHQQTTQYSYDTMGQLVSVTNANAETTQYTYNMLGHVTQITYPNETTLTKQYDELGRLIKRIDGNARTDTYSYDASGNMNRRVDRNGETFTFTYNNRNWLTAKTSPDEVIGFTYNASGQRLTMTDATGVTAYAYNASHGLLTMLTYPDGRTLQYDYDANGQRRQLTDPFGGNVYYRYDTRNRLTGVGTAADDDEATYTYASNGLLTNVTQKNGVVTSYTYNGLRLDTLTHRKADTTVLQAYSYTYDSTGNITGQTAGSSSYAYTYDALNRIATSSQFAESYTYDSRGNRTSMTRNTRFENDNAELVFDDRDRLTDVTTEGGAHVSYVYNGDNLLVERTENGETTRYYYDGPNIIAEATVTGGVATLKTRYIRGKGLIAAEDRDGGKAYYLFNGHGDVTELRDDTGQTSLNRYSYDIWGNPVTAEETVHNSFRYSGELWDDTTSLQYLRARWYDPSEGRFVSEDSYEGTLTNPLSHNLYTYTWNNPLKYIDPSGFNPVGPGNGAAFDSNQWKYLSNLARSDNKGLAKWANEQIKQELYYTAPEQSAVNNSAIALPAASAGGSVGTGALARAAAAASRLAGAIGLLLTISGSESETVREQRNLVYRALSDGDVASLATGQGIVAGNPSASKTALQHVLTNDSSDSQWISTTKRLDVARNYNSGNGIVAIDLRRVTSVVVYAADEIPYNGQDVNEWARELAIRDAEYLVLQYISQSAIVGYVP